MASLLVVGNAGALNSADQAVQSLLQGLGETVTVVDDQESAPSSGTYDLIVICESVNSGNVGSRYNSITDGIVNFEQALPDDMGLADTVDENTDISSIQIVDDTHPIADGFSNGSLTLLSAAEEFFFLESADLGTGVGVVAEDGSGNPLLIYGEAPNFSGRRAHLGFAGPDPITDFNANGDALLENMFTWAGDLGGGTPATVTPSTVVATATVPGPTAEGAAAVSPSTVDATGAVPGPAVTVPADVSPETIGVAVAVPSLSVTVAPVVSPETIAALTTIGAVTVSGGANVDPALVAAAVAVPTPTAVESGADVSVQPSVVAVAVVVPDSAPSVPGTVDPGVVAATVAFAVPTVAIPADVAVDTVDAVIAIPSVTVAHGFVVTPATIALSVTTPIPLVLGASFPIVARQRGRFYRLSGRLALVPLGRSIKTGWGRDEGWDEVSSVFVYDQLAGRGDTESAMESVASAWATHSGSDTATLKSAIDSALQSFGFRGVSGGDLT